MKIQSEKKNIFLIFLGSKGGGLELLRETVSKLNRKFNLTVVVSDYPSVNLDEDDNIKIIRIPTPFRLPNALNPFRWIKIAIKLSIIGRIFKSISTRPEAVIQIMPSPMDVLIDVLAKSSKIPILRCKQC